MLIAVVFSPYLEDDVDDVELGIKFLWSPFRLYPELSTMPIVALGGRILKVEPSRRRSSLCKRWLQ